MKNKLLRLLLAEDYDDDAFLVLNALERDGFQIEVSRVMTPDDFRAAVDTGNFDLILCDYVMLGFDALDALEILRESGRDIPLIVISGVIGEVVATEAMRHGAVDYLLKDNLVRLGAAVEREVRESEIRRQKRIAEEFSRSQTEVLEMIFTGVPLLRILEHITRLVENLFADEGVCSIMLANAEGTHLEIAAAPGLPSDFFEALGPIAIRPGVGSCGSAAALGRMVVVEDLATHPDWSDFRTLAAEYQLGACWSVPVFSADQKVLGVLGIYHRRAHTPSTDEIRWTESASKFASLVIERARTTEKLRESETLLRIASETAHIGGWIVDLNTARVTWSDEVCAIHGTPAGTSPAFDDAILYVAPEWRERITEIFESCVFDGTSFDEEMQIITALGRRVWVRTIGEGIPDEDGRISRIQGAFQDITSKKQAEAEAQRMAERLIITLESITDAFFTLDRDWRFTYLNRQAGRLLVRDRGELLGRRIWDEFEDAEHSQFGQEYRRAMDENRPTEFEALYSPLDRWFQVRVFPSAEGLAVYFYDVTESRQAQEQLKLLETCVSRINDIVIITEAAPLSAPGPRIVYVNDAFVRNTGHTREEVLGKSPRFLQGPATQRDRLDDIRRALESEQPVRTELLNYRKDGGEFILDLDIVPVADPDGTVTHFVAVERDITARRAAEKAVRAKELRQLKLRNALIILHQDPQSDGVEVDEAFRRITETTARTLDVARVSIWRFSPDSRALECLNLFELKTGGHSSGVTLAAAEYPAYFKCLGEQVLIAADDARHDACTCEFAADYLIPLEITSMMDAPVRYGKSVSHLLCCEHVGPVREWTDDEKTFAVAVASLVSLALESKERESAQQQAARSHQLFQFVAAATNDTIWDWNLETDAFWWSDGCANLFGWAAAEVETTIHTWIRQIHPHDRSRVVDRIYAVIRDGGTDWEEEYRFVSNNGSISHVLDRGQVIRDAQGKGIRMVGGMMDLTSSKLAAEALFTSHRALQMLGLCNEMLIHVSDETAFLAEVCRIAVEIGGYRMAWVGYAMEDEACRIVPMAHAGADDGYLSEIEVSWAEDHSSGCGPAGTAVRTGEIVVSEDLMENPAFADWRPAAEKRGFRSVICIPLRDPVRTFGLLCLYGTDPHAPQVAELEMLQQMANDLAFGIGSIRSLEERQRTQDVVVKVAQAVSTGVGLEFFNLLTLNMVEALGALGGLVGRHLPEGNSIETLSLVVNGKLMDSVTYGLEGTPCEEVTAGDVCVFERDIQKLFPADSILADLGVQSYAGIPLLHQDGGVAGIMVVFFASPMKDSALVSSTLRIFAARVGVELDRQQADFQIRKQASLLDKSRDAILVRDLDHRVTYWNKSAERLYGWTAAEAIGSTVQELLQVDAKVYSEAHAETLLRGEWLGEMHKTDKSGREVVIEARWTLVRDGKDEPESVFVIDTDITEHRKLEQQFLRAQRMESIGTLAGGIAHDLNNILTPISMAVELLKMRVSDERSTELLDTVATSARRGANMVGQVLSFARGAEGSRLEVDLQLLFAEIGTILRDAIPRNVVLDIRADRHLRTIRGDSNQLHQVILNLCINARDAMPRGGEIRISAENIEIDPTFAAMNLEAKVGPHVLIRVEDGGEGINPEIIEKIFDPFFTTKSVGKGTGLGLSTSLAIVRGHGGFIRVSSQIGKGSCFSVYLPASLEHAGPALAREPAGLPEGGAGTVLIVDDEESIRRIARLTLESHGYRTLLAVDGGEAVSIYREHSGRIDVVLTDMMMPVMDGTATIRHLKEINPAVRIIASSGVAAGRELAHLAEMGIRHILPKPYTAEALLKCMELALSKER